MQNSSVVPYYSQWSKSYDTSKAYQFQNCATTVRDSVYNKYVTTNAYSTYNLDASLLRDYFSTIEKKFNCTGFCLTTYYNENTKTNMKMFKYLFTDIKR
jgi:hypothetical protein